MNDDFTELEKIANAINFLGNAIHRLGTNDAATRLGALEFVALELKEGSTRIADALDGIAAAISDIDVPSATDISIKTDFKHPLHIVGTVGVETE